MAKGRTLALLLALFLIIMSYPFTATAAEGRDNVVTRCDTNGKKYIALTFDDGPSRKYDREILDILDKYSVKATFFAVGENMVRYPMLCAEIAARGHEIGNHTFSHKKLKTQADSELLYELSLTSRLIRTVCNRECSLFRPPEGFVNNVVSTAATESGYTIVLWSIDTLDWTGRDADAIVRTVEKEAENGAIILCHDSVYKNGKTVSAIDRFIPMLQKEGYVFVTVGELLSK